MAAHAEADTRSTSTTRIPSRSRPEDAPVRGCTVVRLVVTAGDERAERVYKRAGADGW